jgi:4-diphosphocytidyl-2-C-methyl-D-erythritol kinase
MGGGLGGGSSNASFFIKALNTVAELNLSWGEMHHYAKQCGSDCSFFLINKPCLVTQTGNEIEPLNFSLTGYWLQLVLPGIHCSTPAAYAAIQPKEPHFNPEDIQHTEINKWKDLLMNDFETNAFQQFPLLQKIKEQFYHQGALYAAMSGSGSAMFAIYNHEPKQSTIFEGCQSITFLLT